MPSILTRAVSFNALAGIFAFRTIPRHELRFGGHGVSMPLRAFLLFGPDDMRSTYAGRDESFNALAGIFAFRTLNVLGSVKAVEEFQCPCGHFCFSDDTTP